MNVSFDQALVIEKLTGMLDEFRSHVPSYTKTAADVVRMIRDEVLPDDHSNDESVILKAEAIIESYLDEAITCDSMDDLLDAINELEAVSNE